MTDLSRLLRSNLKFKHLQLLVTLDDLRHVGKAAESMHLTQPALSKALAELESIVGTRLFERSSRGTEPTPEGVALVFFARETIAQLDRVSEEFRAIETGSAGTVQVGSMMTASALLIPRSVVLVKERSPQTGIRVDEALIEILVERLLLGQLDLIIGRIDAIVNTAGLELERLYSDSVVVVSTPDHPIASEQNLCWADLHSCAWVLPPPGTSARARFDANLARHGMAPPRDLVETGSFLSLFSLVRDWGALAILAESTARYLSTMGLLKILPLPVVHVASPIGIIRVKGRRDTRAAALFCECARLAAMELASADVA